MSRTINALERSGLQRAVRDGAKKIRTITEEVTGANTEPVKAAARVLVKEARRLASVRGTPGATAAPGAPPLRHQRRLVRSIGTAVVDGIRRVGSGYFVARLLEFGTDGDERGPVHPHPFLRPAIEHVAEEMTNVLLAEADHLQERGG